MGQRGVAGAEIIECDPEARVVKAHEVIVDDALFADEDVLDHLEGDLVRGDAVAILQLLHGCDEAAALELDGVEVDRDVAERQLRRLELLCRFE